MRVLEGVANAKHKIKDNFFQREEKNLYILCIPGLENMPVFAYA